ncbi:NADH:quinone oxidoreductase subunit H [Desulfovibrionales bacterium]
MNQLTIATHPNILRTIIALIVLTAFVGLNGLIMVYLERKIAGHIQRRPGPLEVGPHGLLTPLADSIKLVGKQLIAPAGSDRFLFWAAPIIAFLPAFVLFLPFEFGPGLYALREHLGVLLVLAFSGLNVLALCLAGWASNNKYSLLGAARAVAQTVAYEIPLFLAVLSVALMTNTLDFSVVVADQGSWFWQWNIAKQPLAFIIFFICTVAETNRAPFDLPEAESELTAGFHTEYSGMGFGLFFLAEYTIMVVVSAMTTALFLGGWKGPFPGIDGIWWFVAKVYVLLLFMIWLRWTYPRVRFDQILNLCWKWLIPLSLANLVVTAIAIKL